MPNPYYCEPLHLYPEFYIPCPALPTSFPVELEVWFLCIKLPLVVEMCIAKETKLQATLKGWDGLRYTKKNP